MKGDVRTARDTIVELRVELNAAESEIRSLMAQRHDLQVEVTELRVQRNALLDQLFVALMQPHAGPTLHGIPFGRG